jgi:hypothetical protein
LVVLGFAAAMWAGLPAVAPAVLGATALALTVGLGFCVMLAERWESRMPEPVTAWTPPEPAGVL